jgi:hypothetical protein
MQVVRDVTPCRCVCYSTFRRNNVFLFKGWGTILGYLISWRRRSKRCQTASRLRRLDSQHFLCRNHGSRTPEPLYSPVQFSLCNGWTTAVSAWSQCRGRDQFFSSEPLEPPVRLVPVGLSAGVKRPRREADHSRSGAEVKTARSDIGSPSHGLMAWFVIEHRSSFLLLMCFFVLCVAGSKGTSSTSKWHR